MPERLELVVDFATLRAGMLVVVKCQGCFEDHRSMVANPSPCRFGFQGFSLLPDAGPCGRRAHVCACAIPMRIVFRVADGLDPTADSLADERQRALDRMRRIGARFFERNRMP